MKKLFCILLVIFMAGTSLAANSQEKIAKLDDEVITKSILTEYVNNFLGEKYEKMLNSEQGLKKLADFYINRRIILQKARETVNSENDLLKGHMPEGKDDSKTENTMYITAFLKQQINDKLDLTKEEMESYMDKNNIDSKREAEIRLSNEKRKKMFKQLISQLRSEHSIKYF